MNTLQIERLLLRDEQCSPILGGVFAADVFANELASNNETRGLYVVNTDDSSRPGMHWVALCITGKEVEFFDSYGLPPDLYPNIADALNILRIPKVYNATRIQQPLTDVCGQYCIAYCYASARGFDLDTIVSYWKKKTDDDVKRFVEMMKPRDA